MCDEYDETIQKLLELKSTVEALKNQQRSQDMYKKAIDALRQYNSGAISGNELYNTMLSQNCCGVYDPLENASILYADNRIVGIIPDRSRAQIYNAWEMADCWNDMDAHAKSKKTATIPRRVPFSVVFNSMQEFRNFKKYCKKIVDKDWHITIDKVLDYFGKDYKNLKGFKDFWKNCEWDRSDLKSKDDWIKSITKDWNSRTITVIFTNMHYDEIVEVK